MRSNNLQEGDFVRFLNEKQEGIVKRILANGNVIVDIEDGFPIEATPAELVKVSPQKKENPNEQRSESEIKSSSKNDPFPPFSSTDFKIVNSIFIAVIPEQTRISSGPVRLYLVNTCNTQLLFSFSGRKAKQFAGIECGKIASGEQYLLGEFKREDFFNYSDFLFEGIQFEKQLHFQYPKISKAVEVSLPDISQTFPALPSPHAFTKIVLIYKGDVSTNEDMSGLIEKLKQEYETKDLIKKVEKERVNERPKMDVLKSYGLSPTNLEVDLHIEELTNSIEGMSNAEIIQIQLKHFRAELDKAVLRHSKSIVFIHGIGNGRLRNEIRKELKESNLKFRDAHYDRYGAGATEVIF